MYSAWLFSMSRRSFKNAPGFFFLRAGGRTVFKFMRPEDIFCGIPARPHARINTAPMNFKTFSQQWKKESLEVRWYGHVTRYSGLAKTVLQGTVEGRRRRGRQKKRWTDKIEEWQGNHLRRLWHTTVTDGRDWHTACQYGAPTTPPLTLLLWGVFTLWK